MAQVEWTWLIETAWFLNALGAGAYVASWVTSVLWRERYKSFSRMGIFLCVPLVVLGTLLLVVDLGRPERATNVFRNASSWMAIGAGALSAMIPISIVHAILLTRKIGTKVLDLLGGIGSIIAFAVVFYTGMLLAVLMPRAVWFTPVLPWLFVVSSLCGGVAAVSLLVYKLERNEAVRNDTIGSSIKNIVVLLSAELVLLVGYLASIGLPGALLFGGLGALFAGGVLALGILLPLGIGAYYVKTKPKTIAPGSALLSLGLVLLGGLLLRYTILLAGQV